MERAATSLVIIDKLCVAQIVSLYTTKPGGLYRAMELPRLARIICNVNGSVETGIGNLANLAPRSGCDIRSAFLRGSGLDPGRDAVGPASPEFITRTI